MRNDQLKPLTTINNWSSFEPNANSSLFVAPNQDTNTTSDRYKLHSSHKESPMFTLLPAHTGRLMYSEESAMTYRMRPSAINRLRNCIRYVVQRSLQPIQFPSALAQQTTPVDCSQTHIHTTSCRRMDPWRASIDSVSYGEFKVRPLINCLCMWALISFAYCPQSSCEQMLLLEFPANRIFRDGQYRHRVRQEETPGGSGQVFLAISYSLPSVCSLWIVQALAGACRYVHLVPAFSSSTKEAGRGGALPFNKSCPFDRNGRLDKPLCWSPDSWLRYRQVVVQIVSQCCVWLALVYLVLLFPAFLSESISPCLRPKMRFITCWIKLEFTGPTRLTFWRFAQHCRMHLHAVCWPFHCPYEGHYRSSLFTFFPRHGIYIHRLRSRRLRRSEDGDWERTDQGMAWICTSLYGYRGYMAHYATDLLPARRPVGGFSLLPSVWLVLGSVVISEARRMAPATGTTVVRVIIFHSSLSSLVLK